MCLQSIPMNDSEERNDQNDNLSSVEMFSFQMDILDSVYVALTSQASDIFYMVKVTSMQCISRVGNN